MTKGHSLTEALIALALSSLLLTGALSCQWFAQQRLQLSIQQLQAATLLTELHHLLKGSAAVAQLRQQCQQSCLLPAAMYQALDNRLQQLTGQGLVQLRLCISNTDLTVSWLSQSKPTSAYTDCGAAGFQQLRLAW